MRRLKIVGLVVVVGLALVVCDEAICRAQRDEAQSRRGGVQGRWGKGQFPRDRAKKVDPAKAEEEYLKFLKTNFPSEFRELKDGLESLKENHPEAYQRRIQQGYRRMSHLNRMKEQDPESYETGIEMMRQDIKCLLLAKEYKDAETEKEKEKVKTELKEVLNELFDLRLQEGEARVKKLEEQVSKLKEHAAERKENKAEIVERRLGQLTGASNGLEW